MTRLRPQSESVAKLAFSSDTEGTQMHPQLSENKAHHHPRACLMMELTRDPQEEQQAGEEPLVDPKSWGGCGCGKTRPWPSVVWQWPSLGARPS